MRTVYPDCDMDRWSVRSTCCELLANADYYYTKDEVDYLLKQVEGMSEDEVKAYVQSYVQAHAATKEEINELAEQVRQNSQAILNTYTKSETNSLLDNYLSKLSANSMFANYSKIEGTTLVLNSQNVN